MPFKGAITELSSREWGTISAKSFYQWHCVNILSKSAVKTVSKLYLNTWLYSQQQFACTKKDCWSIKFNNEVTSFNTEANTACKLKPAGKVVCLASSCFSVAFLCYVFCLFVCKFLLFIQKLPLQVTNVSKGHSYSSWRITLKACIQKLPLRVTNVSRDIRVLYRGLLSEHQYQQTRYLCSS